MTISSSSAENNTLPPSLDLTSNLLHWASTASAPERKEENVSSEIICKKEKKKKNQEFISMYGVP